MGDLDNNSILEKNRRKNMTPFMVQVVIEPTEKFMMKCSTHVNKIMNAHHAYYYLESNKKHYKLYQDDLEANPNSREKQEIEDVAERFRQNIINLQNVLDVYNNYAKLKEAEININAVKANFDNAEECINLLMKINLVNNNPLNDMTYSKEVRFYMKELAKKEMNVDLIEKHVGALEGILEHLKKDIEMNKEDQQELEIVENDLMCVLKLYKILQKLRVRMAKLSLDT